MRVITLKIKLWIAKIVFGDLPEDRVTFGNDLQKTILKSLAAEPHPDFSELKTLRNLAGEDTGYVKVYRNQDVERLSLLSINVAPGMRYINMHIIAKAHMDLPRFNLEGMLTSKGSQLSLDLYSDADPILDYDSLQKRYKGLEDDYERARKNPSIKWQASRLPHMRSFCSPFFLLAYGVAGVDLPDFSKAAEQYFQHWLQLYEQRSTVQSDAAAMIAARRQKLRQVMIASDPDRDMIVATYGAAITEAIEVAVMP
jgi:hypothetical protein